MLRHNIVFVPLVVETLGGWDSEAAFHLKSIAEKTAHRSNQRPSYVVKHFFQRLSVILQRANSALIATRAPLPLLPTLPVMNDTFLSKFYPTHPSYPSFSSSLSRFTRSADLFPPISLNVCKL